MDVLGSYVGCNWRLDQPSGTIKMVLVRGRKYHSSDMLVGRVYLMPDHISRLAWGIPFNLIVFLLPEGVMFRKVCLTGQWLVSLGLILTKLWGEYFVNATNFTQANKTLFQGSHIYRPFTEGNKCNFCRTHSGEHFILGQFWCQDFHSYTF